MTINRREFFKLSAMLAASAIIRPKPQLLPARFSSNPNAKNVLIIVFDALSATNINFYGYPRETMPNLTRLLDRATVYHNHYAAANFTTPGTASLLTGRFPWEHLALKLSNEVRKKYASQNLFSYLDDYYKLAYTHNHFADFFLYQFGEAITLHEYYKNLFLEYELNAASPWFDNLMRGDEDTAALFKTRLTDTSLDGYLYSLIFRSLLGEDEYELPAEVTALFPRGIPSADNRGYFTLEDGIDWTMLQAKTMPQPFLGYFHFLPPHSPYCTRQEFINSFAADGFAPPEKQPHPVVIPNKPISGEEEGTERRFYDEFLLYTDAEFNRLFDFLNRQGILDNTLVIFTSDHGEMFERHAMEHNDPYLFEAVVKVPLIIFEPGQTERKDIHTLTSCIDLLPTLLDYTGHQIPASLPGKILPGFTNEVSEPPRTIYAMDARLNQDYTHITTATISMRRDNIKVIRYSGYEDNYRYYGGAEKLDQMQITDEIYFEVFDLDNDPEELNNLAENPTPEIQTLIDDLEQYYRENIEFPD